MSDQSAIEWTDATWNPTVGCSILSPGCTNCYAMKMAARLEAMGQPIYQGLTEKVNGNAIWTGKVEQSNWGQVIKPLSWKKPRMIFVNSMSDLFHEDMPLNTIDLVFAVMACAGNHSFQVLTKRADRMRDYISNLTRERIQKRAYELSRCVQFEGRWLFDLPLPNVWLGVSCERQQEADERIPHLLQTPAAVRFISAEPLLGPINLRQWLTVGMGCANCGDGQLDGRCCDEPLIVSDPHLDWAIVGGESGHGARPMNPQWARDIRDQCAAAGVAYFFKQWGEYASVSEVEGEGAHFHFPDGRTVRRVGKKKAGRLLDGREHNAFPATPANTESSK